MNSAEPSRCATPGCPNEVIRNTRGRPRLYCTPACRAQAHRYDSPDRRAALAVELDHEGSTSAGRPTGHIWLVRLRRGNQHAVLATGLGRPSAELLATQIRNVLNPPELATTQKTR
jgi:hypothetical protein